MNEVTKLLREVEANCWRQELNNTESTKDFWKLVATITYNRKLNKIGSLADDQGHMVLDDKNKAETMNDYYVAVGPNLALAVKPNTQFSGRRTYLQKHSHPLRS